MNFLTLNAADDGHSRELESRDCGLRHVVKATTSSGHRLRIGSINHTMNPTKQCCENCQFWKVGDLSAKNIGNVGQCIWMLAREADFYAKVMHVPFWAKQIIHQTASYDGEYCNVFERATKKQRKVNYEATRP